MKVRRSVTGKCPFPTSSGSLSLGIAAALLAFYCLTPACSSAVEWKEALGPRPWSFPYDHGSHPEYRTEWWYFTGNLADRQERRYGYQLTFFRYGLAFQARQPANAWSIRDLYLAHFALTDAAAGTFHHAERVSRRGPGLAKATEGRMDLHVLNWSAVMRDGRMDLAASHEGMHLALRLASVKPAVLHGRQGLSKKGPGSGEASYYYSLTALRTDGTIRTPGMAAPEAVRGTSWFDQEFGSNQMTQDKAGWDWFALRLSDGRDLMVYSLRRKDGTVERESSGTLVERNGVARHLRLAEIETTVLSHWKSGKSGGRYPSAWRIRIPGAAVDLSISPLLAAQELVTTAARPITYWEGAVSGQGLSQGKAVAVEGFVELTGYAGALGGVF